jgi:hypothetical protein
MKGQPSPYSDGGPYVIPEAGRQSVNVLPTDRLVAIVALFHVMEQALIEIAATPFVHYSGETPWCFHCTMSIEEGCMSDCPGLLARRALGVA